MGNTAGLNTFTGDPRLLSPVTLAFIGDGVFELLARESLLDKGGMPANRLHVLAVKKVKASAQAKAYEKLIKVLDAEELDILRRGRNANTSRIPKSSSQSEYRKATAVEAVFGYLYLCGRIKRVLQLYEIVNSGEE